MTVSEDRRTDAEEDHRGQRDTDAEEWRQSDAAAGGGEVRRPTCIFHGLSPRRHLHPNQGGLLHTRELCMTRINTFGALGSGLTSLSS